MRGAIAVLFVPFLLAAAAAAQTAQLRVDGQTAARPMNGDTVRIAVRGGANLPVVLCADLSPGPVTFLGRSWALGFTPAALVSLAGFTDANGDLTLDRRLVVAPQFQGLALYLLAVIGDPMAPSGLDVSNGASVTVLDRNLDLAGRSLGQYPFFDHATAFNAGTTVEFGIDPTRYPVILGKTVDVYVVAHKSRAQWLADPTLVDVTGGKKTFTFANPNIQASSFPLDTGTLSGAVGGPGLGVPYDVVIDFDGDARFDPAGDLADGFSDAEAGFYVVHDLTQPGPYAVTEVLYNLGGTFRSQDTYYPTNIAQLGVLPLVVVGHGNGHNYQWYDHIGQHLASYGYVVMSHENDTVPGSHTAAVTTQQNTDAFLGSLPLIAGGALVGHVDANAIVWLGHSRGGDGVVRAYDNIFDGRFTPQNYTLASIRLISSMAPVDFGGTDASNPHSANYHLWVGQSDTDVNGCADNPFVQWYKIHDRAQGARASISLYGVGHDDFHNQVTTVFATGPCLIGKATTHLILKGYLLALVEHFLHGNVPAKDYLWRPYETLRPIGVPTNDPCIAANLLWQDSPASGKRVIDDFQTNSAANLASSGAAVTMTVPAYVEDHLDDRDIDFAASATDLFNGFTMDASSGPQTRFFGDNSRGCVLSADGLGDYDISWAPNPGDRDWRTFEYLSLRAAQGTRDPLTLANIGDATFTITLVDGAGASSSISIGAYGDGIEQPYQRTINCAPPLCNPATTCGAGVGWNSEFETIRIRLGDFANNGSAIDLGDVAQMRLRFGPSWGSAQLRLGLDEIELCNR